MKKLVALLMAAAIMLSATACSFSTQTSSKAKEDATVSQATDDKATSDKAADDAKAESKEEKTDDKAAGSKPIVTGKLESSEVTIESARLSKDVDDKQVVILTYKFTNNSDESASFFSAVDDTTFQKGVELERGVVVDDDYKDGSMKEVKKGASIELDESYILTDEKSPVEIELTEFMGDKKITATIDPTKLK